jgi:ribA/ribD-fused uncharacterized protein
MNPTTPCGKKFKRDYEELSNSPSPIAPDRLKSPANRAFIISIINEFCDPMEKEITFLKRELELEKEKRTELEEKLLKLECQSRRVNLKFSGVQEKAKETPKDCKNLLLNIFEQVGLKFPPRMIERAHRLGPKAKGPRTIIARFFHAEDRELILERMRLLRERMGIFVEEDFPEEIQKRRRIMDPIVKKANSQPNRKTPVKLNIDKIILDNKSYDHTNLNLLPESLTPKNVFTKTNGKLTAFYTASSPLSNHHPSPMIVQGVEYSTNEQYYFHQKCKKFNDMELAAKVMKCHDPGKLKSIVRNIKNFDQKVWANCQKDIMKAGLQQKFQQNEHLKEFLIRTGDNTLIEASPRDTYWGSGHSLWDNRIWDTRKWTQQAKNTLGNLLMEVRRDLKQQ